LLLPEYTDTHVASMATNDPEQYHAQQERSSVIYFGTGSVIRTGKYYAEGYFTSPSPETK